jgi:SNF2 family DNA or RNA helicase
MGVDLVLDESLIEWANAYQKHAKPLRDLREAHGRDTPALFGAGMAELFKHQRSGIDLIVRSADMHTDLGSARGARYLILDSTGTGKTYVALGAIASLPTALPAVILCPKSVIRSWATAGRLFFPKADIREVHGAAVARRKALASGADIYIMSYESLRSHSRILSYQSAASLTEEQRRPKEVQAIGPRTLIVDEVHRCASPTTLQTRAAWAVADDADHVIAMTGTPIQESPEDLWAVLRMLDKRAFGSKTAFRDRYLDTVINPFGGWEVRGLKQATRHEFFDLFHTMSRRAIKEDVLPFLPPKLYEVRWVELPAPMRKAYKQMVDDYLVVSKDGEEVSAAQNPMVVAGRLIQLANAPLDVLPPPSPGEPEVVRMVEPSPKVTAFMADVAAGDFDGASVVVFSDSRQLLELCAAAMSDAGLDFTKITGDTSTDDRNAAIEEFQQGRVRFILISRAGDTGITLTAASVMVRLTRAWSYITHVQAADRVHRIGSERHSSITYVDYVTQDSIEEQQIVRLNAKRERAGAVLDAAELREMLRG